jgi:threonine/homoserine/homoserine lactone efflux protein
VSFLVVSVLAFVLAFVSAMPIAGPIAVLVVSRGIEGRFTEARKIGYGAAVAEGTYAGLAFGTFSTFFAHNPAAIPISRVLTMIVLIVVGSICLRFKPRPMSTDKADKKTGGFGLGFATSGLNPTIFISWTGIATAFNSYQIVEMRPLLALPFGASAAAGIICWYAVLLALMTRYHSRLPQRFVTLFIRGMGVVLIGIALWTGFGVVRSLMHT